MKLRRTAQILLPTLAMTAAGAAYLVPATASTATTNPASPASALRHAAYPHHLTAAPKGFQQVDNAPKGDSMGDEIVDTFALTRAGHAVGTLIQYCVLADPARGLAQCSGTVPLPGGRLTIGGEVDGSAVTTLAVLGGTGRYRDARGVVVFTPHGAVVGVDLRLRGVR